MKPPQQTIWCRDDDRPEQHTERIEPDGCAAYLHVCTHVHTHAYARVCTHIVTQCTCSPLSPTLCACHPGSNRHRAPNSCGPSCPPTATITLYNLLAEQVLLLLRPLRPLWAGGRADGRADGRAEAGIWQLAMAVANILIAIVVVVIVVAATAAATAGSSPCTAPYFGRSYATERDGNR